MVATSGVAFSCRIVSPPRVGRTLRIAWGSQIRSYVLNPYQMVKDHRTNVEEGNVQKVLDGELDPYMEAYLKLKKG